MQASADWLMSSYAHDLDTTILSLTVEKERSRGISDRLYLNNDLTA